MKTLLKKILFMLILATHAHEAQASAQVLNQNAHVLEHVAFMSSWAQAAVKKCAVLIKKEITIPRVFVAVGVLAGGYYAWKKNKQCAPSQIPEDGVKAQPTEPATVPKVSQAVAAQSAEILSASETVPSTNVDRDLQTECDFNVHKINALVQDAYRDFWYFNCSCYAIFFANLLMKHFEGRGRLHDGNGFDEKAFQSKLKFQGCDFLYNSIKNSQLKSCFLTEFNLFEEFRAINTDSNTALKDAKVCEIVANVNPKITVILAGKAIADRLKNSDGYQVLVCKNKNDHWIAFGIDYLHDKIYFLDSLGYLNRLNQKYSSVNRAIISEIRSGMEKLKKPTGGGAGGGGSAV